MEIRVGDRVKVLIDRYKLGFDSTGMAGRVFLIYSDLFCVEFEDGSVAAYASEELISIGD